MSLGVTIDQLSYELELGLPVVGMYGMFELDPLVKSETIHFREGRQSVPMLERGTSSVLGHDGRDLAAALQTIRELGDGAELDEGIDTAFPGASLMIQAPQARFSLLLQMPGFQRPFEARELSDGTLRYLCLLAALLSPRPPALLALNEPETSIHPDLIEPMAQLIVRASQRSQLWVTTHSEPLAHHITNYSGEPPIRLEKVNGETEIAV